MGLFVVGIGASAGGLSAITGLLRNAFCHQSMCFVVVSHIPREYHSELAQICETASNLVTQEVAVGMPLEHCHVYTIPPNFYVGIDSGKFTLTARPTQQHNHSAYFFFQELAREYGENSIGVVLSGARVGADGAAGVKAIKNAGGHTFAQEPSTAEYPDMPRLSIATGCVDSILDPAMIGHELSLISWIGSEQ